MAIDADHERPAAPAPRVVAQLATPTARGVVRLVAIVAACAAGLYLVYLTRGVLKLCAIAVFTAIALAPVVDVVQRWTRLPRAWSVAAVYVACVLAVVGVSALIVPSVGSQVRELSRSAQHTVEDLRNNATVRRYDNRYHLTEKVQAQLQHVPAHIDDAAGPLRDVTVGAVAFFSHLVAVMSIAFLLILHDSRYADAALGVLPAAQAARWRRVGPRIYRAVSGYVLGNLAISAIAGTFAWLALMILGVPFAVPLAIVVGFLDLIPMVGATFAALLVALAALIVSPLTAVLWLVLSALYQQVENYVIAPIVYRRSVEVSPLATILAVLVGAALLGLLGALLAIPAAAALQLIIEDVRDPAAIGDVDDAGVEIV